MVSRKVLVLAVAVGACAGCSGRTPYPVSGRIVYEDGTPVDALQGGSVTFESLALNVSSSGSIQEGGQFKLDFLRADDGALAGTYKVSFGLPDRFAEVAPSRQPVASEYLDQSRTPLTVTVEEKSNTLTLTVKRPKQSPSKRQ